jgi:hypothetical protein
MVELARRSKLAVPRLVVVGAHRLARPEGQLILCQGHRVLSGVVKHTLLTKLAVSCLDKKLTELLARP